MNKSVLPLLALTVLLSACSGSTPPDTTGDQAPLTRIGGQVKLSLGVPPYSFPDSAAVGQNLSLALYDAGTPTSTVDFKVSDDLKFQLDLPTRNQIDYDLKVVGDLFSPIPATCQVLQDQISDVSARISSIDDVNGVRLSLNAPKLTISGNVELWLRSAETDKAPLRLVYADKTVTIKLNLKCPTGIDNRVVTSNYDLSLRAGWNFVQDLSDKYGTLTFTYKSVTPNPNMLLLTP